MRSARAPPAEYCACWFCPPDLAHFDHLIWPTWVVILCIIPLVLVFRVLSAIDVRRSRGGGNVGIAAAISKGWGKVGKTALSFSHAFHRPSFPRPCFLRVRFSTQCFLLLSSVLRKRNDSVPVSPCPTKMKTPPADHPRDRKGPTSFRWNSLEFV